MKIGSLWKGKDKDGHPMLTGSIDNSGADVILKSGGRIGVFANRNKTGDNHPDYYINAMPAKEDRQQAGQQAPQPAADGYQATTTETPF